MIESKPLTGQTIPHYRALEKLGGGRMGLVCKAADTEVHHFVAPKFLRERLAHNDQLQLLERFGREAQAASAQSSQYMHKFTQGGVHAISHSMSRSIRRAPAANSAAAVSSTPRTRRAASASVSR